MNLNENDIVFAETSLIDEAGKVFFYKGGVYRAIYRKDYASLYSELLAETWINELFNEGLVETEIESTLSIDNVELILKHKALPYFLSPQEFTDHMFFNAVRQMVRINLLLAKNGYLLKDSHAYNFTYHKGKPVFFDFGSLVKRQTVTKAWLNQFITYCAIPLKLASTKRFASLSKEYRKEHSVGFGKGLFSQKWIQRYLLRDITNLSKKTGSTVCFFAHLLEWVDKHRPIAKEREYWSHYNQAHTVEDVLKPQTIKQRFVYDTLYAEKPSKVLDLAANRGFYSEMATRLGASVVAFDYEENLVDDICELALHRDFDITPAHLNFIHPSPNTGWGLMIPNSFERFKSDVVLALGLIHHLCITQKIPIELFCKICMQYAKNGVILEYVSPEDRHIAKWPGIPANYSLDLIQSCFKNKFPLTTKSEWVEDDGVKRLFVYFHK